MPADSPRSVTPTQRVHAVMQAPVDGIARQDLPLHYLSKNGSPPRTPPRRRKDPPSSYPKSARLAAATGAAYFDESHGYERGSTTDEDLEDPHNLTYSSKHFPRASMVDNMVLALDQFSHPLAEQPRYGDDDGSTRGYRGRGHTFSSSVSSESDVRTTPSIPVQPPASRPARRSSARYARDPTKLPSIFGEDEDSSRVRIYEAQRAAPPVKPKKPRPAESHPKGNGSTSSIDLSHLKHLQGRLGPAGNRRSQSFDFGTRRPNQTQTQNQNQNHDHTDAHAPDTAPHPVIHAGPKSQRAPSASAMPPLQRRGSARAFRSKPQPSTLGTSAVHGTTAPLVAPKDANANANATGKKSPTSQTPDPASVPRSGLFKRFFGSSKTMPPPTMPPVAPPPRPSHDQRDREAVPPAIGKLHRPAHKDSLDLSHKEHAPAPPTITKKPSSFFRRRKKSVSTTVAPPLPLTLNAAVAGTEVKPGQQSPVSSLKAFMDPYLADDRAAPPPKSPTRALRTFYVPGLDSAGTGRSRTESPEPARVPRPDGDKLAVPQKETFLTDSSSCEDLDHSPASDVEHSSRKTTPRAVDHPPLVPTIRPVTEHGPSAWPAAPAAERLPVPPRKDSLLVVDTSRSPPAPSTTKPLATQHRNTSGSDVSEYRSAPSTPACPNGGEPVALASPSFHVSHPSVSLGPTLAELDQAQHIYNNGEEDIDGNPAAAWLGEAGSDRERIRQAYMDLFDWTGHTILAALRRLCSRLILRAESQLIDRILDAFARRWCAANPNHGFKSADVVHTICYSILLLNTDLHMADIGSKMTRSQFVRNAMQTIRPVAAEDASGAVASQLLTVRSNSHVSSGSDRLSTDRDAPRAGSSLGQRPLDPAGHHDAGDLRGDGVHGPLVDAPFAGSPAGWEIQIEGVLKDFYHSIHREPLPLFGSDATTRYPPPASSNNHLLSLGGLRRTPSVLSKGPSEGPRSRHGDSKSLGSKWSSKVRSRPRLGSTPGFGSSKNSLEDQSSAWSPGVSSTWSKASLGKTLTSMSVDSFATSAAGLGTDYQSSIGFANALSQAIIRDDQLDTGTDDGMKAAPWLDDETLELEGAPWAKEGILKHKCHLEGVEKRSKDRNWNDCFAVIEKGWMRLFSFSVTAKSLRSKARHQKAGGVVGGGNWQENAEEVWKFMLRHTIASSLPPPGYSKQRPHVWALSLPTGAVHLFAVGTADIVKEFVSTANYWSARLSKEPMIGGISSMEFGWSDAVIHRAWTGPEVRPSFTSSELARPSTQLSVRSSLDHGAPVRPKLPGDKIHISDWAPPTQSLLASQLMEVDQLKALQMYVHHVEEDLQKHNELRNPMVLAFSPKHANHHKAMSNWEKKSSYLLREIVKFKNYIDALQSAQLTKERIYKMRQEEERQRQAHDDSLALSASSTVSTTS